MAEFEFNERKSNTSLLMLPDYSGRVTPAWFDPECWGELAQPVSSGGRGGAWFIDAGADQLVLREYRRGGLVANFSQRSYVYTREKAVRSFAEFRLLNELERFGLPVPKAIAACYTRVFPRRYQASIIVERLNNAVPLAERVEALRESDWYDLGETIRLFHDANVRHADLNCFNVLIRDEKFYLIDFDKGQVMLPGDSAGWKSKNLDRFARSMRKVAGESAQSRMWEPFMSGYYRSGSA